MNRNPAPAVSDPLLSAVIHAQAQQGLFDLRGEHPIQVVVAVSGGADSVCLLHVLWQLAEPWGLALHVAHVNHGLRPAAAADGEFVAALAADCGLPFHVAKLDPAALRADRNGLEAAARTARYAFLAEVARSLRGPTGPALVAAAHHAGDQAETLLLRLVQGSGLRGLGALRPLADVPAPPGDGTEPVRLVRPLLAVEREEILAYLRRHKRAWVEDETNTDLRFARNRLRHVVLPALAGLNPNIVGTLARTAGLLADEAQRAEAADAAALAQLLVESPVEDRVVLDMGGWQLLPPAARRGVLRQAIDHLAPTCRQIGQEHIDQIARSAFSGASSGPHSLPAGLAWTIIEGTTKRGARLCLHAANTPPVEISHPFLDAAWRAEHDEYPLPIPGEIAAGAWRLIATRLPTAELPVAWQANQTSWQLYASAETLGQPVLTTPKPGMRIAPFGMGGRHRRVVEVLNSCKVPPSMRLGWPILVDRRDGRVLWVCGLRSDESLRIPSQARDIVCCKWQIG
ncbi:MAG: tRNA lysidine(34) synthetase TilS [Caldilineaceae bacterium]